MKTEIYYLAAASDPAAWATAGIVAMCLYLHVRRRWFGITSNETKKV